MKYFVLVLALVFGLAASADAGVRDRIQARQAARQAARSGDCASCQLGFRSRTVAAPAAADCPSGQCRPRGR